MPSFGQENEDTAQVSIQATDTVEFERCRQEKHVGRESRRKGLAFEAKQDEWYATPQTSGYGCRSRFELGRIRTFAIGTNESVVVTEEPSPWSLTSLGLIHRATNETVRATR